MRTLHLLKEVYDETFLELEQVKNNMEKIHKLLLDKTEIADKVLELIDPELDKKAYELVKSLRFGDESDIEDTLDPVEVDCAIATLEDADYILAPLDPAQTWRFEPYPWPDGSTSPLLTL